MNLKWLCLVFEFGMTRSATGELSLSGIFAAESGSVSRHLLVIVQLRIFISKHMWVMIGLCIHLDHADVSFLTPLFLNRSV